MPAVPEKKTVSLPGRPEITVHVAQLPKSGIYGYEEQAVPGIPNDQEYAMLETSLIAAANQAIATLNGKAELQSSTKVDISGSPGRDVVLRLTFNQSGLTIAATQRSRMVFTGKSIVSLSSADIPGVTNDQGDTVLNSLRRVNPNGPNLKLGNASLAGNNPSRPTRPGSKVTFTAANLAGQVVRSSDGSVAVNLPTASGEPEKKQSLGAECLVREVKDPNGRYYFAEYSLPLGKTTREMVMALVDEPIPGVKSPGGVQKRDLSLEGRPTFEIFFEQNNELHKAKIIGYGSKAYVLLFAGAKEKEKEKGVADFLRSFRVGS